MWNKIIVIGMVFIMCFSLFCGCKNGESEQGSFYDIQTALDNELLTENDIRIIAEKHNNENFDVLTDKESLELKKAYAVQFPRKNLNYESVVIEEYLGKYKDCQAVIIHYEDEFAVTETFTETFFNVEIHYKNGFKIKIYEKIRRIGNEN